MAIRTMQGAVLSRLVFLMISSFVGAKAEAWGHVGHEQLAEVATTLTTNGHDFWTKNQKTMGVLANVPDVVWKSSDTYAMEKSTHFFQPDSYADDPAQFEQFPRDYDAATAKYSTEALAESGTATWRAKQLYDLAVTAFKNGDFQSGIEYAGTMSHYIGGLSQPLHVTKNYDGADTGDKGIHAFFETTNIQHADLNDLIETVTSEAQVDLNDQNFRAQSKGAIIDTVFNEVSRAYSFKDMVIDNDLNLGRSGKGAKVQLALAETRMADGAATLSMILSKMWSDAGNPNGSDVQLNPRPGWVKPDYSLRQSTLTRSKLSLAIDDDCDL